MARGKIHFEVMGSDWTQDADAMAVFVARLEGLPQKMAGRGEPIPRVVCTDRGPGFITPMGHLTHEYKNALDQHRFRPYVGGVDGIAQPGDLAVCWPEERSARFVKYWLEKHPVPQTDDLDDMEDLIPMRMKACADHISEHYDVDSVSRG